MNLNTYRFLSKFNITTLSLYCTCQTNLEYVPKCRPVETKDILRLQKFIDDHNKICVLSGAGVSTESGIPDYRSAGVGLYAKSNRRPVLYKDFCENELIRKRYWARNYVGWPRFSSVKPNDVHKSLQYLEDIGKVNCIITQNVDNLHTKAGSKKIIELHGTAFKVMCLSCDHVIQRSDFQVMLEKLNSSMSATSVMIRPDGDVDLSEEQVEGFNIPPCFNCGGILKPSIVFFGDNVHRNVVGNVRNAIMESDSLLILGTSLSTYSGYRILLQAIEMEKPTALVNIGTSRADDGVNFKIESRCGEVLSKTLDMSNQFKNQVS